MTDNTRVFNVFPVFFRGKTGGFRGARGGGRWVENGRNGDEGGKRQIQGRAQKRNNARVYARNSRKAPHRSGGFS